MQGKPVVVTRPRPQAEVLAGKIAGIGRQAIVFPLLEIENLPDRRELDAKLADLASYALVAFVSPNAIDAAFSHLRAWPEAVEIAVMGEGSLLALARYGVTISNARIAMPTDPMRSGSESLLMALDLDALRGRRALVVRGETGREFLADALRAAGVEVDQVAAYRRRPFAPEGERKAELIRLIDAPCDWVLSSSEALRHLAQAVTEVRGAEGLAALQQKQLIVSHPRIAETAHKLGFHQVMMVGAGDERLLTALQFQP